MSCNGTLFGEGFVTLIAVEDPRLLLLLLGLLDLGLGHVPVGLQTDQLGSDHLFEVLFRHLLPATVRLYHQAVRRGPLLGLRHDQGRRRDAGTEVTGGEVQRDRGGLLLDEERGQRTGGWTDL